LDGKGATLCIAQDYPVHEYDAIICFKNDYEPRRRFVLKNLNIECRLGQKFNDRSRLGDTYMIYLGNCDKAVVKNVSFSDYGKCNNVSFLVNAGANLDVVDCNIVSHSGSQQGGGLWLMNKYRDEITLRMNNVYLEYDSRDERVCIAADGKTQLRSSTICADIRNCTFKAGGDTPSSGFFIMYSNSERTETRIRTAFRRCRFVNRDCRQKPVLSCQGAPAVASNSFKAFFKSCSFDYSPSSPSREGLFKFPQKNTGIPRDFASMKFANCYISARRVPTIIGDYDGATVGKFEFHHCTVSTDSALFVRNANPGEGDILISCFDSDFRFGGNYVTTEGLYARRSRFYAGAATAGLHKAGNSRHPLDFNVRRCLMNDADTGLVSGDPYPLSVLLVRNGAHHSAEHLLDGTSILLSGNEDELHIYYMSDSLRPPLCSINGQMFKMSRPEGSSGWFFPVGIPSPLLKKGAFNIISVSGQELRFRINEF